MLEIPAAAGGVMGKTWESGCHGANRTNPQTTMKNSILSILRHSLTGLAGLGGFLASKGLADAGDAASLDAAGVSLADALAVIAAAVLARMALWAMGKVFSSDTSAGVAGWIGLAGFLGFSLPACSPQQMDALKQTPVKVCYIDKSGAQVCYSNKDGLTATVDKREGLAIPPGTAGTIEVDTESGK